MQRIFVEMTIQIHGLVREPSSYTAIQTILQTNHTITSTYVWMEVQRTLGQDYQYLIELLLTKQPATVGQLLGHLGFSEDLYSARRIKRLLQIMTYWLGQFDTTTIRPIEMAYQLRSQYRRILHKTFFEQIDQVLNPTVCDLIQPNYTVPSSGRMSCRRETARCSLHELLRANDTAIQKLQADSAVLKALDANTQRALREITNDFTVAKGEQNCWSLGDLIIVLECPPDALLWTTNLRHFAPLCQAFGRQLFQPDAQ